MEQKSRRFTRRRKKPCALTPSVQLSTSWKRSTPAQCDDSNTNTVIIESRMMLPLGRLRNIAALCVRQECIFTLIGRRHYEYFFTVCHLPCYEVFACCGKARSLHLWKIGAHGTRARTPRNVPPSQPHRH